MIKTDWTKVKHFSPEEDWGDPDKMNPLLIYSLDALRKFSGRIIVVNNGYREGDDGEHGKGNAADVVIMGLSLLDQFLLAEKTRLFTGIGIYPFWNRPGLHLDVRELQPNEHGARWGRNAAEIYVPLNGKFIRSLP